MIEKKQLFGHDPVAESYLLLLPCTEKEETGFLNVL